MDEYNNTADVKLGSCVNDADASDMVNIIIKFECSCHSANKSFYYVQKYGGLLPE